MKSPPFMRKILLLFIFVLQFVQLVNAQQDAQFSQYMFNGIYINPAYAGYKEQLNMHAFYRNQWTGFAGSPKTMSLAVDAIANDGNVGLALQISNDKLGAQSNLVTYANYAYRVRMNSDGSARLAFGIGIGAIQLGIDGARLNPNNPESDQPSGMQSTIIPDARTGVFYSDSHFYAGLSVDNIISQHIDIEKNSFVAQPKPHYYLTGGMLVPLTEAVLLKPSFLLKDDRGGPSSLDLNLFVLLGERIWIGGSYRTGVKLYDKSYLQKDLSSINSAVAAIEIYASSNFRIGYAYDISVGPLQGYSGGTHEISLGYYFNRSKTRMLTPRYF